MWDLIVDFLTVIGAVAVGVFVIFFYWVLWTTAKLYMKAGDGRVKAFARAYWLFLVWGWDRDKGEEKLKVLRARMPDIAGPRPDELMSRMPETNNQTPDRL